MDPRMHDIPAVAKAAVTVGGMRSLVQKLDALGAIESLLMPEAADSYEPDMGGVSRLQMARLVGIVTDAIRSEVEHVEEISTSLMDELRAELEAPKPAVKSAPKTAVKAVRK